MLENVDLVGVNDLSDVVENDNDGSSMLDNVDAGFLSVLWQLHRGLLLAYLCSFVGSILCCCHIVLFN